MRWDFWWFVMSQTILYSLFYLATRSAMQAHLSSALAFDAMYATVNYWAIRKISKSENPSVDFSGYLIGSLLGTVVGVLGSVWFLGK